MVTFVWRLAGFAMSLPVVGRLEPGRQHLIQLVQGENLRGPDFGLQLALAGLKEAFDQAPGRRISWGPVKELDIELGAGQLRHGHGRRHVVLRPQPTHRLSRARSFGTER